MIEKILQYKEIIGNAVGVIAVLSGLRIYSYNDRKKVLAAKLVADSLWAVHFILIGAVTGALLNVVNVVRDGVFYNRGTKKWADSLLWIFMFFALNIASGIASYDGYISLVPITGSSLAIIGLWLSDSHKMRLISFVAIGMWFVYAGITHSVPSFVYNGFVLVSITIGLVKDFKSKVKNEK